MNKIPKLTKEQINDLDFSDGYSNSYVEGVANDIYLTALKIADQQGLLTKEASLALKPDNHIEWGNFDTHLIRGITNSVADQHFFIHCKGKYWQFNNVQYNSLQEAQEACQELLNEYLKENQK